MDVSLRSGDPEQILQMYRRDPGKRDTFPTDSVRPAYCYKLSSPSSPDRGLVSANFGGPRPQLVSAYFLVSEYLHRS